MKTRIIFIVSIVGLGWACSPTGLPVSSDEGYKEDLTSLRPEIQWVEDSVSEKQVATSIDQDYSTLTPQYDVTPRLNAVLDSIIRLRENVAYVDGFTILVYSGTNSEMALLSKGKVFSILPESTPTLKFDEPNFRVKVGKYYSRIEAQRDYAAIKQKFSKAIIIPERIYFDP